MKLDKVKKFELHLHLEGAASPHLIKKLAAKRNVDISKIFNSDGLYKFTDFKEFLSVYEIATTVLQTPEDFYSLTMSVLEECAKNNVIYLETFVSPKFCGGNDVVAWKEFLAAICEAADQCEAQFGIISRGIITCIRHLGPDVALETAKCAVKTSGEWLVGFGMAGDESFGRPKDYAYSFQMAKEAGLKLTSHAGEWCGAQSVRATINDLDVQRVGHGVQSIDDQELVAMLVDKGIVLEVCPGSNVFLGVYPTLSSHPIKRLRDQGVKVTISTDDPPFFRTTMNAEYESLSRTFGWTESDFLYLNRVALDAAFCDEATKDKLLTSSKL